LALNLHCPARSIRGRPLGKEESKRKGKVKRDHAKVKKGGGELKRVGSKLYLGGRKKDRTITDWTARSQGKL